MKTADKRPPDFDWVAARAKCSVPFMFETLRELARGNVAARNGPSQEPRFDFTEPPGSSQGSFPCMSGTIGNQRRCHSRLRKAASFVIRAPKKADVRATVTLNDEAECKLKLADTDEELDPWQLLRRVLEPVLFREE